MNEINETPEDFDLTVTLKEEKIVILNQEFQLLNQKFRAV